MEKNKQYWDGLKGGNAPFCPIRCLSKPYRTIFVGYYLLDLLAISFEEEGGGWSVESTGKQIDTVARHRQLVRFAVGGAASKSYLIASDHLGT